MYCLNKVKGWNIRKIFIIILRIPGIKSYKQNFSAWLQYDHCFNGKVYYFCSTYLKWVLCTIYVYDIVLYADLLKVIFFRATWKVLKSCKARTSSSVTTFYAYVLVIVHDYMWPNCDFSRFTQWVPGFHEPSGVWHSGVILYINFALFPK